MDIFPTILDVVGIDQPANLDGCSLLPIMKGKTLTTLHPFLAWDNGIMGKHGHEYAVRQGDWKIVKTVLDERKAIRLNTLCVEYNKHCWNTKTVMGINFFDMDWMEHNGLRLYNLKDDISETEDLSVKYPDIVRDLKNTYKMWHSEMK
jgi:arylsulfatase A-like enzyme